MSERQAYSSSVGVGSEPSRRAVPSAASRAPLTILATRGCGADDGSTSLMVADNPVRPRNGLTDARGTGMRPRKLRRRPGAAVGRGGREGSGRNFSSWRKSTERVGAGARRETDLLDLGEAVDGLRLREARKASGGGRAALSSRKKESGADSECERECEAFE